MVGIYKITTPSGKVYIGQSVNIKARWICHISGKKNRIINNSIKKHGVKAHLFEVIHELPKDITKEILDRYELFYWQQYKDCGIFMLNVLIPGQAVPSNLGRKFTEEHKRKIGEAVSKKLKGRVMPDEVRNKIRDAHLKLGSKKGHPRSDETKKLMSSLRMGKPSGMKGKKLSEETKAKLSIYRKGIPLSESHRKNISIGKTKNKVVAI